ncbi:MAG: hypothetical protein LBG07_10020 [Treponema sp.]|jgi:hypothetical protein|nr:hypothetical protein [Treponema sp.]
MDLDQARRIQQNIPVNSCNKLIYRHFGGRILPRTLFFTCGFLSVAAAVLLFACNSNPRMGDEGIANLDPIPAGSIEAEFPRFFSSAVEKKKVDVVFCPRDNTVYLEFKYQTVTYRQYWNLANRAHFMEALNKYKGDYEAKNLVDKPYRTRRIYGTLKGMAQWGYPLNLSILVLRLNSMGYPNYEVGYVFKEDSSRRENPYFTVFQRESKDILMSNDVVEGKSANIFVYYTRAQAEDLANIFNQDYLLSLIRSSQVGDPDPDVDTY